MSNAAALHPAEQRPGGTTDLSSTLSGLSTAEARQRLREYGWNEPASETGHAFFYQCVSLLTNPILLILLAASFVSALLGQTIEAAVIATMLLLSAVIDLWQSYRAQTHAGRLKLQVAVRSTVLRDGEWAEIPRREVVPGDVVRVTAGDMAPADALLVSAVDLHLQEAALTGESLPVGKSAPRTQELILSCHRLYLGTSVVSGCATAQVTETGVNTELGKIASRLSRTPVETSFERNLRQFGILILKTTLLLVLFVFLANVALRQPTLEAFLFAVALAVGLTPEFLPMITTVTLSQGAMRMAREKVIVKRLAAIQNFGSIDIFCSDKTGTLTLGEMRLEQHVDATGNHDDEVLRMGYLNSLYQTGVVNPLDKAVHHAATRTPLEDAILREPGIAGDGWNKIREMPFDFERRRVSVVLERGEQRLLIVKGAPENMLPLCVQARTAGLLVSLEPELREAALAEFNRMGDQGFRVLAIAVKAVPKQESYGPSDEHDLSLFGFLSFSDPPLPDARRAIEALSEDGVQVKILTGDNDRVARHICGKVGLSKIALITSEELGKAEGTKLSNLVEQNNVFTRVTPSQKIAIIESLRKRGHVVGFMGDGINDAPALRAADVGVSVAHAVDIARDAADIILMEPGLHVLHKAIREGRRAFVNVIKYLFMGTSSNFGNMVSMAAASFFLPFLPMTASQILINNFLYDSSQLSIPSDNVDEAMLLKPRRWDVRVLRRFMVGIGPISSIFDFLTFFVLLRIFHASQAEFQTGWFVESLATQTLVLFVIRTTRNPFRSRPSKALAITIFLIVGFGVALPYLGVGRYFGFTPLPAAFFGFLLLATIAYLSVVDFAKKWAVRGYLD
jgi:P-type Mg2+ transporter